MARRVVFALAIAAAAAASASSSTRPAVVGISWERNRPVSLVRYDAASLQRLPGSVPLAGHGRAWSFSPGGARLVLARSGSPAQAKGSLRFVDLRDLRVLGSMPLDIGWIAGTAWLRRDRMVATVIRSNGEATLALVDPLARRELGRRSLTGRLMRGARAAGRLVLLLGPSSGIGSARLAIVDGDLGVRFVPIARIAAGWKQTTNGGDPTIARRSPGLAVDVAGARAFVVGAHEPLAEVDLASARVTYRPLALRTPARSAKSVEGPERLAVWLGGHSLAVTGRTYEGLDPTTRRFRDRPAGLMVVDVRTGEARMADPDTRWVTLAGRWLLEPGHGLTWYGRDGRRRGHLFGESIVARVAVAGDRAFVQREWNGGTRIVDLRSGEIVGSRRSAPPYLLRGDEPIFQL